MTYLFTHRPCDNWQERVTQRYSATHHRGLDISMNPSERIYAMHGGTIRVSEYQDTGFGNVVVVSAPGDAYETTYAHMTARNADIGDAVQAGDVIGFAGSTGTSTGVHVHIGLRVAPWERTPPTWGYSDPSLHFEMLAARENGLNRIGPYVLTDFASIRDRVKALQPSWIVLHDGEAKLENIDWLRDNCPHTKIICRWYRSDSWYNDYIRSNPVDAAHAVAHGLNTHECTDRGVWWITSNEVCQDWSGLDNLNEYYVELQRSTHERLVIASSSVENLPWTAGAPEGWEASMMAHHEKLYPAMRAGLARGDVYGVHQYNAPRLENPTAVDGTTGLPLDTLRITRYERLVWPNLPDDIKRLPVVVAEFGWDLQLWPTQRMGGVLDPAAAASTQDATDQLRGFFGHWDAAFGGIVPVIGHVLYSAGDSGGWDKYRIDVTGGNLDTPLLDAIIDSGVGRWDNDAPPIPIPPQDTMKIYDRAGNERDWNWLTEKYGDVQITPAPTGKAFRIVRIEENPQEGNSSCKIRVLDEQGNPSQNYAAQHWPDAPQQPEGCATRTHDNFVPQLTDANGYTAYAYGSDSNYMPPGGGAYTYWICSSLPSDSISGLGLRGMTNHEHLDLVFAIVDGATPPPPHDLEERVELLESWIKELRTIMQLQAELAINL